jgi:polar amino acid transport system substrate-binding protein
MTSTFDLRHLRYLVLVLAWLMLAGSNYAQSEPQQVIRIAAQEGLPYLTEPVKAVVIEAYRRIGVRVEIVPNIPLARVAVDTNSGVYDAALAGNASAGDRYPNVLRTTEPVYWVEYGTFAIKSLSSEQVKDWAALKASSLRIGGRQGHHLLQSRLGVKGFYGVSTDDSLVRMLLADRIDIAIVAVDSLSWEILHVPSDLADQISKVRQISLLERVPMYHFINKRYAALIPRFDEALKKMESDGTLARLFAQKPSK